MDNSNDDITPPLGMVADPAIQRILERTWHKIDTSVGYERKQRVEDVKNLHDRSHKVSNAVEVLNQKVIEHHATDEGRFDAVETRFGTQEEKMQTIQAALQEIRSATQKSADSSGNLWKWLIGHAIAVLILVIGAWFLLDRRVTTSEVRQENTTDDVNDLDEKLDRMDEKLDRIEDRIAPRAVAPVSP